jgi:hypothetical protein
MPVWLGASCVFALLGMGLFSQNVITRKFIDIEDPIGGVINISRLYDHWSWGLSGDALGDQGPGPQMVSYGISGFAYASNVISQYSGPEDDYSRNGQFDCNTAECTFQPYNTLRICARCMDVSPEVIVERNRFVLRSGLLSLDIENGVVNVTSDTDYPGWHELNVDAPVPLLVRYLALGHDNDFRDKPPVATECVAYWCVGLHHSYTSNNLLYEMPGKDDSPSDYDPQYDLYDYTVTNTSTSARTYYGQEQDVYIRLDRCQFNQTTFDDSGNCTFRVTATTQLAMQNFLSKGYLGNPFLSGAQELIIAPNTWRSTSFAANAIASVCYSTTDDKCQDRLTESMSTSFTNMTMFMSNVIRKTHSRDVQEISYGTSYESIQVYHIR